MAVLVCGAVAGGAWITTRDDGGAVEEAEEEAAGERIVVPLMTLGSGELPGGETWTLEARRDGGVCTTLKVSVGRPPPERCLRSRSYRPVGNLLTVPVPVPGPTGPVYLTLGQVSDRTERVRIAPDGVPPWEVPTVGADTGLEVRFFVTHMTARAHTSFTALAADGTVLGRVERPKPPAR